MFKVPAPVQENQTARIRHAVNTSHSKTSLTVEKTGALRFILPSLLFITVVIGLSATFNSMMTI